MKSLLFTTAALFLPAALLAQSGPRRNGFIPMLWDADSGKLYFEIAKFDQDILYLRRPFKARSRQPVQCGVPILLRATDFRT